VAVPWLRNQLSASRGSVQSQARLYGICGGHSATVTDFPPSASYLFCQYYFRNVPHSYFFRLPPTLDNTSNWEHRYMTHFKIDYNVSEKLAVWVSSLCKVAMVVKPTCEHCGRVSGCTLNPHSRYFRRVPTVTKSAYHFRHVNPSVCLCMYVYRYVCMSVYPSVRPSFRPSVWPNKSQRLPRDGFPWNFILRA